MILSKIQELEKAYNVKVIYCIKSGSMLYGTNSESSDTDYIGIFVPNSLSLLLKRDLEHWVSITGEETSKNTKDDVDIQFWSIHKFLNLVKKGETGALDLLFSLKAGHFDEICVYKQDEYLQPILDNFDSLLSKDLKAFVGYCLGQAKRYNIKGARYNDMIVFLSEIHKVIHNKRVNLDTKVKDLTYDIEIIIDKNSLKYIKYIFALGPKRFSGENVWYLEILGRKHMLDITVGELLERLDRVLNTFGARTIAAANGIDNKALSHATRIILECEELLESSKITFPSPNKKFIKDIKYHPDLNAGNDIKFMLDKNPAILNLENLMQYLEQKLDKVNLLLENSTLPSSVNQKVIDEVLMELLALKVKQEEKDLM